MRSGRRLPSLQILQTFRKPLKMLSRRGGKNLVVQKQFWVYFSTTGYSDSLMKLSGFSVPHSNSAPACWLTSGKGLRVNKTKLSRGVPWSGVQGSSPPLQGKFPVSLPPLQEAQVQSLVREARSHVLRSMAKKKKTLLLFVLACCCSVDKSCPIL